MLNLISAKPDINGAHDWQTIFDDSFTPNEYLAIIPKSIQYPSMFPYVTITIENGYVVSMENNETAYKKAMEQSERNLQLQSNLIVDALVD